ncbi:unnamed protein product, partial [Scytosiphon promiscuus]
DVNCNWHQQQIGRVAERTEHAEGPSLYFCVGTGYPPAPVASPWRKINPFAVPPRCCAHKFPERSEKTENNFGGTGCILHVRFLFEQSDGRQGMARGKRRVPRNCSGPPGPTA